MNASGYTASDKHREARQLRDEAKEVGHEIEQNRRKLQEAERLQGQFAAHSQGDKARSAAAIVVAQRLKQKARKEMREMEQDKQNLEREAQDKEKEAKQEQERQRQAEKKRQRSREASRDNEHDHEPDPF